MNSAMTVFAFASLLFPADGKAKTANERITIENLVTAKPLPPGYASSASELKEGDKLEANMVIVQKEGSASKVVITIEPRELRNKAEKRAAAKGYVNGMSQTLTGAGMKLLRQKIPNLEKENLDKRLTADLVFQSADGNELFVQVQVFFTKVGHNVMVFANNKDDLKMLSIWARSVEGVKSQDK